MTTIDHDRGHVFDADGVTIAYDNVGEGPPVVLIHGFASDRLTNWRGPGWYDALVDAGRRVLALDCRGHGESDKPGNPADYGPDAMAEDVVRLLDHLDVDVADVVGYSMGGRIALQLMVDHPDRVNAAVLGGVGDALVSGPGGRAAIAAALEADDLAAVSDPVGRRFRAFAERRGGDLTALAAVMRSLRPLDGARLAAIDHPVLLLAGEEDEYVDDSTTLAGAIDGVEVVSIPDRNHMTTVGDPRSMDAVRSFLDRRGLRSKRA